ncbi:hypothetical protein [Pseudonocardia sp. KRD291]|uniref:hypothetical protein n=1 Tax=Pseudonocardia sp. KRD291 TaxID=2792007 RepID=UPI001C4A47BE|nr:hypothetical protein [Pseudonocardia sp. KRD291]MBW0105194.1 hypothetical protein [Pseudonocardia sp. KRD291]
MTATASDRRAAIRFVVGARGGPHSRVWEVRRRAPAGFFVGPAGGPRTGGLLSGRVVLSSAVEDLGAGRLSGPRFPTGSAGPELAEGWQVVAAVLIPAIALRPPGPSDRLYASVAVHALPRPGWLFQIVVAYGAPGVAGLSIAPGNDAGSLRGGDGGTVRLWLNHVPHPPDLDPLIRAGRQHRAGDPALAGTVLRSSTTQDVPVLVDTGG